jgi:hypothetical protein
MRDPSSSRFAALLPILPTLTFVAILLILFKMFVGSIHILFEPTSQPKNVFTANVTDRQISLSWVTDQPTRGAIVVSGTDTFPLLPTLAKPLYRDDGEKYSARHGYYYTHHVTIGNLKANTQYRFRIYQGLRTQHEGTFMTAQPRASLSSPHPVYGTIYVGNDKKPASGALVYLTVTNGATPSSRLSTLATPDGSWSMDLGNLRSTRTGEPIRLSPTSREMIVIDAGKGVRGKAETMYGTDTPWPVIILPAQK